MNTQQRSGGVGRRYGVAAMIAGLVALASIVMPGFPSPESHAQDVQPSSGQRLLDQQQVEAVKQFAVSAERAPAVNFPLSVGAAVPRAQSLQDMPRALGEALPHYINDQYLVVGRQFVIVEKNTRRIIAIVPIA